MIGALPKSLEIGGKFYPIRSDFRVALLIFEAYDDPDLTIYEKAAVCIQCLFETPPPFEGGYKKALWFLDGGDIPKAAGAPKKLIDWKQDESLIFPAVNRVAGFETRTTEYMHWWSFLGLFGEVGEGLFSQVINIRSKKSKCKKLEKHEKEFYREHKELIDLKVKYTVAELEEIDRINSLLGR